MSGFASSRTLVGPARRPAVDLDAPAPADRAWTGPAIRSSPRLLAVRHARACAKDGPRRLALAAIRRNETSPDLAGYKTLAYLDNVLARRDALAAGADEALMLNGQGEIAGCAAASLFWIERERASDARRWIAAPWDRIMREAGELAAADAEGLKPEELPSPRSRRWRGPTPPSSATA